MKVNSLNLGDKKIVIVEDDLPSVRYYETLLRNSGASIKVFRNGKEFVDYISTGNDRIDLVFMDFLVPLVNGIECTRIFRRREKKVPVIMVTGYASEQSRKEAFLAGCNEYILKPILPEKIFSLLEKYLFESVSSHYLAG
ncbi:MAG TPA: response regulator [Bacteroidales bacterium]|nr:response regulator [Bacteroidales bacterium]HOS73366.1 response regulator [Bacteroidales bacterium]HQH23100.1 response regulator [Bacteroidales bacterium]HQJ81042.1 response regulator [Bacteroidales bacterium]